MYKLEITGFDIIDENGNLFDFRTLLTEPEEIGILIGYDKDITIYYLILTLKNNKISLMDELYERKDLTYKPFALGPLDWFDLIENIKLKLIKIKPSDNFSRISFNCEEEDRSICFATGFIKKEYLSEKFIDYKIDSKEEKIIFKEPDFGMDFCVGFNSYYRQGPSKIIKEEISNYWENFDSVIIFKDPQDKRHAIYCNREKKIGSL